MPELVMITGGARNGKSAYAERLAKESGLPVVFVATALPLDDEMRRRIERHRAQRPGEWRTVEEPLELVRAVANSCQAGDFVIVECLSTWSTNVIFDSVDKPESASLAEMETVLTRALAEVDALAAVLNRLELAIAVVTNEVGMGIVPDTPLGRAYRDLLGAVNQRMAGKADRVILMVAGLPMQLKP